MNMPIPTRWLTITLVLIGWCVSTRPARAQDTDTADPQATQADEATAPPPNRGEVTNAEIRRVLRELESDELATRDAAEKQLVEMGPNILPFLPTVTPRTSGEMKVRLQRIRQTLQQSEVQTFFEASTVTLAGAMDLGDALKSIEEQTGNAIELQNEEATAGTGVEVDYTDAPFWTVISDLMSQANLRINAYGATEGQLVLSPGGGKSEQMPFEIGPFHVEMVSVQTRRIFNSQIDGQLDLSFQVAWEPRLKPVFMQIPMASVSASLADDQQLAAVNAAAAPEIPLNLGGCATQVDLQLARPDRSVSKIDSLKGELVVAVPGERHQYVFKKFGNGARQNEKFGDVSVTLEGARKNGAVYEMRIMVEFGDAQGALESFRGWILSNEAYLLDANDKRLENVGLNTYSVRNNGVGIAYLFQINADPNDYKLIYESPAAISKQKISYELKDIELP
ncbi:MAG: hypothetical protein R3C53_27445 [Pirellulaceae bacterium]